MNKPNGEEKLEECVLSLRVIPRAKKNEVIGFMQDGRLKIKIKSPPVDGRANEALTNYLAKILGIKKGGVEILSGKGGREKRVLLKGLGKMLAKEKLVRAITKSNH